MATLCVLAGCTALLYVRGERETFIHVALPEAIVATTGALLEGQHGEEPLHAGGGEARSQGLGAKAAEAKDENEATPVHYARPTETLEAGPAPSKVDGEGATSLVEALNAGVASPSEAKDWATPLVAASSTLTAPACPLAAAASNSTPKHHLLSAAPAPTWPAGRNGSSLRAQTPCWITCSFPRALALRRLMRCRHSCRNSLALDSKEVESGVYG